MNSSKLAIFSRMPTLMTDRLILRKMLSAQLDGRQPLLPLVQKAGKARQVVPLLLPCHIRNPRAEKAVRLLALRLSVILHRLKDDPVIFQLI